MAVHRAGCKMCNEVFLILGMCPSFSNPYVGFYDDFVQWERVFFACAAPLNQNGNKKTEVQLLEILLLMNRH